MANSCKYYTEKTLAWMLNNKLIVFLSLLCFCLFVSTWALAAQKNKALSKIDDLNAQLATTTTLAPVTNPEEPVTGGEETEGNGTTGGDGDTGGNGETGGDGETEENGQTGENGETGDNGNVPSSRKSNAAIDEKEVDDQEDTLVALPGAVNSDDNIENESYLRNIVQNSKLLAALAA